MPKIYGQAPSGRKYPCDQPIYTQTELLKKCFECGIEQPLENFQRKPSGKGRISICDKCRGL